MRIGVVGINHKLADVTLRELFAKICHNRFGIDKPPHLEHTLIPLTTCNRCEIYFSSPDLTKTHSYILHILRSSLAAIEESCDQKLYSYFGNDCFIHLCRVTAGLDSAIVAETEIQGQVKTTYEASSTKRHLPPELHYLFQKALTIGKRIRRELPLGRGIPDLEHAILNAGYQNFTDPEETNVLFVGASDINCKILGALKKRNFGNITLCNRSPRAAYALQEKHGVNIMEWPLLRNWPYFDFIIFGTKSEEILINKGSLAKEKIGRKLIIDLSVPRNVDPKIGFHPQVTLLNIDKINRMLKQRKEQLQDLLATAENIVQRSAEKYLELFSRKEESKHRLIPLRPQHVVADKESVQVAS